MTQLSQSAFSWSNAALLEALVAARFEQGRLLALNSSFVHSYEFSDVKKQLYTALTSADCTPLDLMAGWGRNPGLDSYLQWWFEPPVGLDPIVRAGIAFYWFLLIMPFDSKNFEVASALCELALQENERTRTRLYDISLQLSEAKSSLLEEISSTKSRDGDITEWLLLFLHNYVKCCRAAYSIADKITLADKFWKRHSHLDLNSRQRRILSKMLEENCEMTNRLYVLVCGISRESAKRDLAELVNLEVLTTGNKKGRSVTYSLF